jgi:hypothetical protein
MRLWSSTHARFLDENKASQGSLEHFWSLGLKAKLKKEKKRKKKEKKKNK